MSEKNLARAKRPPRRYRCAVESAANPFVPGTMARLSILALLLWSVYYVEAAAAVPGSDAPRRLRAQGAQTQQLRPHLALAFGTPTQKKHSLKCWHKCHSKCALKCSRFAAWPSCDRGTVACKVKLAAHYDKFEGCITNACKECYEFCHTLGNGIDLDKAKPPAIR